MAFRYMTRHRARYQPQAVVEACVMVTPATRGASCGRLPARVFMVSAGR